MNAPIEEEKHGLTDQARCAGAQLERGADETARRPPEEHAEVRWLLFRLTTPTIGLRYNSELLLAATRELPRFEFQLLPNQQFTKS
jgi:hypothetical protein